MNHVRARGTCSIKHATAGIYHGSRKAVSRVRAAADNGTSAFGFCSLETSSASRRRPSRTRHGLLRQCVLNTQHQQEGDREITPTKSNHVKEDDWRREVGMTDSVETMTLNREHGIAGFVRVTEGRGGLPKVTLTHPSGSECDVYLFGANIVSWNVANGGEVLFTPESEAFDGVRPICWGAPICFPKFGEGGPLLRSMQELRSVPEDGIAQYFTWTILQTGVHQGALGEFPYVSLELTDNEHTRAMWNHSFRLKLEISLNCAAIDVEFEVENTGVHAFEYSAALKSHIAVTDIEQDSVKYIGLDKCMFVDNLCPAEQHVHVVHPCGEGGGPLQLTGPTQRVYLNSQNNTGIEVGTGCTVYLHDRTQPIMRGFDDCAVWNKWKQDEPDSYRWYAGLAIGAIGKLIKLEPGKTNISFMSIEVADIQSSSTCAKDRQKYSKESAQHQPYDLKSEGMPMDMQ